MLQVRPGSAAVQATAVRTTIAVLTLALLMVSCGSTPRRNGTGGTGGTGDYHIVRTGETLYTIAWRYGKDYRDLARWNHLGDGSLIFPGQLIKLYPPQGKAASSAETKSQPRARPKTAPAPRPPLPPIPSEPPPAWAWPTDGRVMVLFGDRPGTGTGVLIGGKIGQPVRAAAAGKVMYSGSGLIGYGQLIIVKHNDTYLSAYGYNASLLVKEGDTVRKGQRIATMGEGPERQPRLHFEIRRNGKPVDPRQYLPAR